MVYVAQVRHRRLTHVAVSRRQLVLLINVQSLELVVVLMLVDVICPPTQDPTVCESLGLKVGKYCKNAYLLHHMERRCHYRSRVGPSKRHRRVVICSWHGNTAVLVVPRLILMIEFIYSLFDFYFPPLSNLSDNFFLHHNIYETNYWSSAPLK